MFDWMLPEKHAIAILKKDHDTVKELFEKFEKTESSAEKEKIIVKAVEELKIHAAIEDAIFYPTVRKHVGKDLMNEADEEHHVARVLIAELDANAAPDHRHAKFTVLAESVRHHIKEEETEMLPKAKELDIDFEALGDVAIEIERFGRKRGSATGHDVEDVKGLDAVDSPDERDDKQRTLKSGSGKKVTSRRQAVAMALSEARRSGAKVPRKRKS